MWWAALRSEGDDLALDQRCMVTLGTLVHEEHEDEDTGSFIAMALPRF
jgi:hypothetical protein